MKTLPRASKIILAVILGLHLVLIGLCFGCAMFNPGRAGLAPVVAYMVDLPASWVIMRVARLVEPGGYSGRLVVEAVTFATLGSLWWLLLVSIVSGIITATVPVSKYLQ